MAAPAQADPNRRPRSGGDVTPLSFGIFLAAAGLASMLFVGPPTLALGLFALIGLSAFVVVYRRLIRSVFGPVFFYDLIRTSRRGSVLIFRCLYAGVLLVVLYAYYMSWATHYGASWSDVFQGTNLPIEVVSDFNNKFFLTFLLVQLLVVFLATPIYAAGAITEEKERQTLEYVLATDVGDAEFVLGKLAARLASMGLLLATGLPILALTQFLGGVDFEFLLGGFAMTLLTMFTVGSLSAAVSVRSARTIDAVFGAYFFSALFFLGSLICGPCCALVNLGNPLIVLLQMSERRRVFTTLYPTTTTELDILRDNLGSFTLSALLESALLCWWTVLHLRSAALQPRTERSKPLAAAESQPWAEKPPIDDEPMIWKELYADAQVLGSRSHRSWLAGLPRFLGWAVLVVYVLPVVAVLLERSRSGYRLEDDANVSNYFLRPIATGLGMTVLLMASTAAAGKISHERERMTLDGLLTSPLTNHEILLAKLLGALSVARPMRWAVLALVVVGVLSGGVNIVVVPVAAAVLAGHAAFLGVVGLWCSQVSRNTVQATVKTLAVFLVMMVGAPLVVGWGATMWRGSFPDAFLGPLLTPWLGMSAVIIVGGTELQERQFQAVMGAACSPALYGFLAYAMWRPLCRRFEQEANRLTGVAAKP